MRNKADTLTAEQIAKLPIRAQKYIQALERERETAVEVLNKFCDGQTKAPFSVQEHECTGEQQGPSMKVRYIQARRMNVEAFGIYLSIYLRPKSYGLDNKDEGCIELSYNAGQRGDVCREVALIPESLQKIRLITKEMME